LAYLFVPLHPATNKGRERKVINAKQKEGRLAHYSCLSIVRLHHATNKGCETPRAVTPAAIRDLRPAASIACVPLPPPTLDPQAVRLCAPKDPAAIHSLRPIASTDAGSLWSPHDILQHRPASTLPHATSSTSHVVSAISLTGPTHPDRACLCRRHMN
jgi:hypothetical protein